MEHSHNFLGEGHEDKEWRTWMVIALCTASMVIEIICGVAFGSLALVADGVHMGTHVLAFFITASAYSYARIHADDPAFVFGTGKVGELASFTCAILLVVVSLIIVYEGIYELIYPVELDFRPALAVSFVGLTVNILSGMLLILPCGNGGEDGQHMGHNHNHGHSHGHSHGHNSHSYLEEIDLEGGVRMGSHGGHDHQHGHAHSPLHSPHDHSHGHGHAEAFIVEARDGNIEISIFEEDMPPEFRLRFLDWHPSTPNLTKLANEVTVRTIRPDGAAQTFAFVHRTPKDAFLRSIVDIPEPHAFTAEILLRGQVLKVDFAEDGDGTESDEEVGCGGGDDLRRQEMRSLSPVNGRSSSDRGGGNRASAGNPLHGSRPDANSRGADTSTAATSTTTTTEGAAKYEQDNNFRAAVLHVIADAFVSVLTIIAIAVAGTVKQAWFLNPLVGMLGAGVILSWSYQLITDTMCALLDLSPDAALNAKLRDVIEADGVSQVTDLHIWKLGPGKLGVIVSIITATEDTGRDYYASKLARYKALAHITIEIVRSTVPLCLDSPLQAHSPYGQRTGTRPFSIDDGHDHSCTEQGHDHSHAHSHGHSTRKMGSAAYAALQ